MEDEKIIALFFDRNEEAIRQTDASYGRRLNALAVHVLQNQQDAQECVSDTYLKTWETVPPRKPNHFFAYLATICRHFAFGRLDWNNAAKRKAEVVSLTNEMESCIPDRTRDTQLEGRELGRLLNAFLHTLNKENRMVFLRRYWYADTVAQIAQRYGISEGAVMTRLHRTREKLRAFLAEEGIRV